MPTLERIKPVVNIEKVGDDIKNLSNGIVTLTVMIGNKFLDVMLCPREGDAYTQYNLKRMSVSKDTISRVNKIANKNKGSYSDWVYHESNMEEHLPWYFSSRISF